MSKISENELVILKALWKSQRASAREIHQLCEAQLNWSFSSTRTTLARMVDKSLLSPKKVHGITTYAARQTKVKTVAHLTRDFLSRVLEIKGDLPTTAFENSEILTPEELEELKTLIETMAKDAT